MDIMTFVILLISMTFAFISGFNLGLRKKKPSPPPSKTFKEEKDIHSFIAERELYNFFNYDGDEQDEIFTPKR